MTSDSGIIAGRRVRVLHLINSSAPSPYLCAIADHSNHERFQITVASLGPSGPLQEAMAARGVPTFAMGCLRHLDYVRAMARLVGWLRSRRVDIIQTHLFEASLIGLAAARAAGTPLTILTGHHSHEIPLHRRPLLLWIDMVAARWLAHRIMAPSIDMLDGFVRDHGVLRQKIAVIPYGFEFSRLRSSAAAIDRLRRSLGIEGKLALLAVGRLYWVKDYPCLFEAFAAIRNEFPDVALLIAGDGPDRLKLVQQVEELGLHDHVKFLGHRDDVVDVMAAADALVHPSLAESFGQVIVEALALGKPVISTAVGVSPEIIQDGVNGFIVSPHSPAALAEALRALLRSRGRWDEMGRSASQAVQRLAAEIVIPKYEAQYVEWLGERGVWHVAR